MSIESKINLLAARLNRLNTRSMDRNNAGVRRKLQRQIRSLKKAMEHEQQHQNET